MPVPASEVRLGSIYRSRNFMNSCRDSCCADREIIAIEQGGMVHTRSIGFDTENSYSLQEFRSDFRVVDLRPLPKKKVGGFASFIQKIECIEVPEVKVKPKRKRKVKVNEVIPVASDWTW